MIFLDECSEAIDEGIEPKNDQPFNKQERQGRRGQNDAQQGQGAQETRETLFNN